MNSRVQFKRGLRNLRLRRRKTSRSCYNFFCTELRSCLPPFKSSRRFLYLASIHRYIMKPSEDLLTATHHFQYGCHFGTHVDDFRCQEAIEWICSTIVGMSSEAAAALCIRKLTRLLGHLPTFYRGSCQLILEDTISIQ